MNSVLRRLRRKPLRSFLTIVQIILGALAMTLALSAYLNALQHQSAGKAERFDLIAGTQSEDGSSSSYSLFEESTIQELLELVPAINKAAFIGDAYNSSTFEKDSKLYQFQSMAYVNQNYFDLNNIQLTSGSLFSKADSESKEAVMLISDGAARILFGNEPAVGQSLNLMPDENVVGYDDQGNPLPPAPSEPYRVIGTFAESNSNAAQYFAFLPTWRMEEFASSSMLSLLAKTGQGDEAREQIVTAARQVFDSKMTDWGITKKDEMFYVSEPGQMWNQSASNLLDPTVVMFGLFGIVALIVGSIGIFSIMLVDALEREREIGIQRTLGATKYHITKEMTLESTLMAGLGGLLGVLLAAIIIPLLLKQVGDTLFWNINLAWQPLAAAIVFALTVLLGLVLGFFPALRAARVKPLDALKGI